MTSSRSDTCLRRYDRIEATFRPRRTDDLRPRVAAWSGGRWLFDVDTEICGDAGFPDSEYDGEWACWFVTNSGETEPCGWVPSGDLTDIVVVRRVDA